MKVPFGAMTITPHARDLVNKALDSTRVSGGQYVHEFEDRFAKLVGVRHAVALSSGTDADILAMAVLYDFGAHRGDEIIVPALSFVATGNAVLHAGFKPVFVDIKRETLNIDPEKIEAAITKKTRAIMPVHLMGKPAPMEAINAIAKKHKLFVIEDAAEAHGAVYKGKNVGLWSDMAAYSTYVAHIITTIEGGIVTTNREDFAEILRSLRAHGRACKCDVCVVNTNSGYCAKRFKYGKDIRFVFERVGYSAKMNELEAAIGLGSLTLYHKIIEKRRHNLLTMIERLKEFDQYLTTIEEEKDERIGPHAFPIVVKEGAPFTRDEFVSFLEKNGIDSRDLFSSMPTQCPGFSFLGYKLGDFPNAEFMGTQGLHIGVHQDINDEHIDYVMDTIRAFLKSQ
ncbi:MAG TPA: DegT/DnrJ/EryC1/StrS family aminotransferase [Candidatus Omnitrophota bacterium]|nr:DegT/DnrJ/EryC1/StrS family aminotransferase [Candidatus Omnitrophota bacterium]HPD84136.1 DegT/DnrJ/EryC1/StrS family aminotransferase [Candidatus Omnitrophota bacterium]HRZ02993.1 DegT/DnrJ/EryC1/StrS family aminotransferase [Candidatus Omnitrophota bacterium]